MGDNNQCVKSLPKTTTQKNGHIPPKHSYPKNTWAYVARCLTCNAIGIRTIDKMCPMCGGVFRPISSRKWIAPVIISKKKWIWRSLNRVEITEIVKEGYWGAGEHW